MPNQTQRPTSSAPALFDLHAIAATFPDNAESLLLDHYLTDTPTVSTRLFRVYRPTPAHLHRLSDEHLLLLSGRATMWVGHPSTAADLGPGALLLFPRGTPHATPAILESPLVFLAIDIPRRDPSDIHFLDPTDGTPETFLQQSSPHHPQR